jgi:hypothetical protein
VRKMAWRTFRLVSISLALIGIGGCTRNADSTAFNSSGFTGNISLAVLETTSTGKEQYWHYKIDCNVGETKLDKVDTFSDAYQERMETSSWPSGHVDSCSESLRVASPDGKFIALCDAPPVAVSHARSPERMIVRDVRDQLEVANAAATPPLHITGFGWGPDSRSIAVLIEEEHYSVHTPLDLLGLIGAHPVPYKTFHVELMSWDPFRETKTPDVRTNVRYGWGHIVSWQ